MKKQFKCMNCNKIFMKYKSQKPKFCCRSCQSEYQKKMVGEKNPNWKGGSIYKLTCKKCGKVFHGKKDRIYCSLSCKSKDQDKSHLKRINKKGNKNPNWKGNIMNKICPNCYEEFRSKRITQKYCSKKCFREFLSEWGKSGHAAYMNSFISNPSKPQIELYGLVKLLYKNVILNYPTKSNFSIDIVIPDINIAIEYDGSYWHDEEKDKIRQKKLEKEGWCFIRYKDYIPSLNKLKEDINGKQGEFI